MKYRHRDVLQAQVRVRYCPEWGEGRTQGCRVLMAQEVRRTLPGKLDTVTHLWGGQSTEPQPDTGQDPPHTLVCTGQLPGGAVPHQR